MTGNTTSSFVAICVFVVYGTCRISLLQKLNNSPCAAYHYGNWTCVAWHGMQNRIAQDLSSLISLSSQKLCKLLIMCLFLSRFGDACLCWITFSTLFSRAVKEWLCDKLRQLNGLSINEMDRFWCACSGFCLVGFDILSTVSIDIKCTNPQTNVCRWCITVWQHEIRIFPQYISWKCFTALSDFFI